MEQVNNYVFLIGVLVLTVAFTVSLTKMIVTREKKASESITELFYDALPYILSYADEIIKLYNSSLTREELIDSVVDLIYVTMLSFITEYKQNASIPDCLTQDNIRKYIYPLMEKLYNQKVVKAYYIANQSK